MLINIYEVGYLEKTYVMKREDLMPTPLNNDASPMDKSEIPCVINTQYDIIRSGANSKSKIKKAIKVKAKAKAKAKPKVEIRKAPPSFNYACVADVLGLTPLDDGSLSLNWFMRADYAATIVPTRTLDAPYGVQPNSVVPIT